MNIFPSLVIDGRVHEYSSGPVYTTVDGARVWVSDGYTASTRDEVIKLAVMNAQIRRGVAELALSMAV